MEKYKVILSPPAHRDFMGVAEYLRSLTDEEAKECIKQIVEKVNVLPKTPLAYPFTRDAQLRLRGYRILATDAFLFFYVVFGNTAEIRRILPAKRQYDWLL